MAPAAARLSTLSAITRSTSTCPSRAAAWRCFPATFWSATVRAWWGYRDTWPTRLPATRTSRKRSRNSCSAKSPKGGLCQAPIRRTRTRWRVIVNGDNGGARNDPAFDVELLQTCPKFKEEHSDDNADHQAEDSACAMLRPPPWAVSGVEAPRVGGWRWFAG